MNGVPPKPGLLQRLAPYRKIAVFVVGAALTWGITEWGVTNKWVALGLLVATGLGIYQVPNTPKG